MALRQPPVLIAFDAGCRGGRAPGRAGFGGRAAAVVRARGRWRRAPSSPRRTSRTCGAPTRCGTALAQVARAARRGRARASPSLLPDGSRASRCSRRRRRRRPRRVRALPPGAEPALSRARSGRAGASRVGEGRVLAAVAWRTVIAEYEAGARGRRPRLSDRRPGAAGRARGAARRRPRRWPRPSTDRARRRRLLAGRCTSAGACASSATGVATARGDEAARLAREVERAAARCARSRTASPCGVVGSGRLPCSRAR